MPARFTAWGGPGNRNGQFVRPRAIAAEDGEVYVIDVTGRVQVFTEEGSYLRQWSLPDSDKGTPTSLSFGRERRVLIPDTHYSRILIYTRNGELVDQWGSYGTGPDQFIYPTGIVEAPDGTLFISEYGGGAERVRAFDKSRNVIEEWGAFGSAPGEFNRAMRVTMDLTGVVYVLDTGNHRVQRFDRQGKLLGVVGEPGNGPGQLKDPYDLALGPEARGRQSLFVCEYGNNRISRFSFEGGFLGCYGVAGRHVGEFQRPRGVAVSRLSATIFVADADNHRVQRIAIAELVGRSRPSGAVSASNAFPRSPKPRDG